MFPSHKAFSTGGLCDSTALAITNIGGILIKCIY